MSYELPEGLETQSVTYTDEQLLRGRLLLLDAQHPLPDGAPAPNTMSVAAYGKGMVPVNGLSVKSGRATIDALAELFAGLRAEGRERPVRMERHDDARTSRPRARTAAALQRARWHDAGGRGARDAG